MRHSLHFVIGSKEISKDISLELNKYIHKYGLAEVTDFFRCFSCVQTTDKVCINEYITKEGTQKVNLLNESCDVEQKLLLESPDAELADRIGQLVVDLRDATINMEHPGDYNALHFCFYVPLYDDKATNFLKRLVELIKQERVNTQIDVVGFTSDLFTILCNETESQNLPLRRKTLSKTDSRSIETIATMRIQNPVFVDHFIVLQNVQNDGVSLNLNFDSFVRILGEFSLICVECYKEVFGIITETDKIQGIGLSVLSMDKFYFVSYLLNRSYIYLLKKEGIEDDSVSINKSMQIADNLLKKWVDLLSGFFYAKMDEELDNEINENEIVNKISPLMTDKIVEIKKEINNILRSEDLSLIEKKAILSAILGQDDKCFVEDIFNPDLLDIRDLENESIQLFVDAHNRIINQAENTEGEILPVVSQLIDGVESYNTINPIGVIKHLRATMRKCSSYIRRLETENEKLKSQLDDIQTSQKCLKDGLFEFGEHKFKLLDPTLDQPLTDMYEAKHVTDKSIDLSKGFTAIKNQLDQGACLAFSLVSVFEYFMKSNLLPNPDLSEQFLYYNARKRAGNENDDCGSCVYYSIESLQKDGICKEDNWKYDTHRFAEKPSDDAYLDAKTRFVRKALSVERNVDAVRSALKEGFPVVISANIFDSFISGIKGFVPSPTTDEISEMLNSNNPHAHAMVICGYSDEDKLFKVRNSWGIEFGDKGYCYMPYSYIENPQLCNSLTVITEIEVSQEVTSDEKQFFTIKTSDKTRLNFNTDDANVQYAINKNLIGEEMNTLWTLSKEDKEWQKYYATLKQQLKNPNKRERLQSVVSSVLDNDISKLEKEEQDKSEERLDAMSSFSKLTIKQVSIISAIAVFFFIIMGVLIYISKCPDILTEHFPDFCEAYSLICAKWSVVSMILGAVALCFIMLYIPVRIHKKRTLADEYTDACAEIAMRRSKLVKDRKLIKLRFHFAGLWLCQLFELNDVLQNKYNVSNAFVNNLTEWYEEQMNIHDTLDVSSQPPFESVLDNSVLDDYFEREKARLVKGVHLYSFMEKFDLTEDGIIEFKANLQSSLISVLESEIKDFSMFDYLSGKQHYNYLPNRICNLETQLATIDRKSKLFIHCNDSRGALSPQKSIFIATSSSDEDLEWRRTYPKSFSIEPTSYCINSLFKLVLFQLINLEKEQCEFLTKIK